MTYAKPEKHVHSGWFAAILLTSALVTGCGGGGGGPNVASSTEGGTTDKAPAGIGDSVAAMVEYITNLFAQTSDSTEPVDVNAVSLATDDTAEPSAVP